VFVREDGETATDSALLVGHHHRLDRRDQFATMIAFAIWLISLTPPFFVSRVETADDARHTRHPPYDL
jgi:hypothetical protein